MENKKRRKKYLPEKIFLRGKRRRVLHTLVVGRTEDHNQLITNERREEEGRGFWVGVR